MRVIRLAWAYPESGVPKYGLQPVYYYLSREQARQGYDVHVITKASDSRASVETFDGVTVHRIPKHFSLNAYRMVRELSKGDSDSIIHTHATCGVQIGPLKQTIGLPLVSQVHGCSHSAHMPTTLSFGKYEFKNSLRQNLYRYLRERALWSRADRILAVSESVKSDLGLAYDIPPGRVDVVGNGVDTRMFRPLQGFEPPERLRDLQDKRIVLYVGHFGLRKGVVFLIRAMKKVISEVPDAVLVCVGGVPEWLGKTDYWGYLRQSVSESGLDGKVLLLDKVPNAELPRYYSMADVFVLPSYYEAFAKVLIEAMACAKPVVVTRGGGPSELVANEESALLVDYGSVEQLANAVIRTLEDKKLGWKLGRNAMKIVASSYTWGAVAKRITESYSCVLLARRDLLSLYEHRTREAAETHS